MRRTSPVFLLPLLLAFLVLCGAPDEPLHAQTQMTIVGQSGGGVTDGDKGDVTVSVSGTLWTLDPATLTSTKLQNVSASSLLLGRGAGALSGVTPALSGVWAR